jgi:hypothetical protein
MQRKPVTQAGLRIKRLSPEVGSYLLMNENNIEAGMSRNANPDIWDRLLSKNSKMSRK